MECLTFALADPSLKGVWAGTTDAGEDGYELQCAVSRPACPGRFDEIDGNSRRSCFVTPVDDVAGAGLVLNWYAL